MHNRFIQVLLVLLSLSLCAYVAWSVYSSGPGRATEIPVGVQTVMGTLLPVELSLSRRGTHVLTVDDENIAYVESQTVNLRQYELTDVGVTGTFHANTDPSDLPVLIVTAIRPIDLPSVAVDVPSVGLRLRVSPEWNMSTFDDGVAFTLTGSSTPILRIMRSSLTQLPPGNALFIGGYGAVRLDGPTGVQTVHLQAGRNIITFTWDSADTTQLAQFAQLLRTAIVSSSQSSSRKPMTGGFLQLPSSAASAGSSTPYRPQPCGGPAGVLCPAGTYCAVHSADGVGSCVPLR